MLTVQVTRVRVQLGPQIIHEGVRQVHDARRRPKVLAEAERVVPGLLQACPQQRGIAAAPPVDRLFDIADDHRGDGSQGAEEGILRRARVLVLVHHEQAGARRFDVTGFQAPQRRPNQIAVGGQTSLGLGLFERRHGPCQNRSQPEFPHVGEFVERFQGLDEGLRIGAGGHLDDPFRGLRKRRGGQLVAPPHAFIPTPVERRRSEAFELGGIRRRLAGFELIHEGHLTRKEGRATPLQVQEEGFRVSLQRFRIAFGQHAHGVLVGVVALGQALPVGFGPVPKEPGGPVIRVRFGQGEPLAHHLAQGPQQGRMLRLQYLTGR